MTIKPAPSEQAKLNALNAYKKQVSLYLDLDKEGFDELTLGLAVGNSKRFGSAPPEKVAEWARAQGWPSTREGLLMLARVVRNPPYGQAVPDFLPAILDEALALGAGAPWLIKDVEKMLAPPAPGSYGLARVKETLKMHAGQIKGFLEKGWIDPIPLVSSHYLDSWNEIQAWATGLDIPVTTLAVPPDPDCARILLEKFLENLINVNDRPRSQSFTGLPAIVAGQLTPEDQARLQAHHALCHILVDPTAPVSVARVAFTDKDHARFAHAPASILAHYIVEIETRLSGALSAIELIKLNQRTLRQLQAATMALPSAISDNNADHTLDHMASAIANKSPSEERPRALRYIDIEFSAQQEARYAKDPESKRGFGARYNNRQTEAQPVAIAEIFRPVVTRLTHRCSAIAAHAGAAMSQKRAALAEIRRDYAIPVAPVELPRDLLARTKANDIASSALQEASDALYVMINNPVADWVEQWGACKPQPKLQGWGYRPEDEVDQKAQRCHELLNKLAQEARLYEALPIDDSVVVLPLGTRRRRVAP
jgi:hypothetical protein